MAAILRTVQGTRYQPSPDDLLWLARAVEAEGEPRDQVAATLVNGFLWAREHLKSHRTLAEWVRAYAVPVSPLWMPGGARYEAALQAAGSDAERAEIRALGWRRQEEFAKRTEFSRSTKNAIERALSRGPEYPGAVDYAAWWLDKPEPWHAFTPAKKGTNRLWARPGAAGWTGYAVESGTNNTSKGTPWLGIAMAAGAGFMLLSRNRKPKLARKTR